MSNNFKEDIDWSGVHLYWGVERCVPPEDGDSNYKMTVDYLTSKINIPKENIHRIKGENAPEYEAKRYADVLVEQLPLENGIPHFDLVILGMGDDGHTASIFPHEIELWNSNELCEVANHPNSGQQRITLTGKIINNASLITFLVTGKNKQEKVREILKKEGPFEAYPATLVAPTAGDLIWFLDNEAAGLLTSE